MISDAYVMVTCDFCPHALHKNEEEVQLTALARRGSYDMHSVKRHMKALGWSMGDDDQAACPDCVYAGRDKE